MDIEQASFSRIESSLRANNAGKPAPKQKKPEDVRIGHLSLQSFADNAHVARAVIATRDSYDKVITILDEKITESRQKNRNALSDFFTKVKNWAKNRGFVTNAAYAEKVKNELIHSHRSACKNLVDSANMRPITSLTTPQLELILTNFDTSCLKKGASDEDQKLAKEFTSLIKKIYDQGAAERLGFATAFAKHKDAKELRSLIVQEFRAEGFKSFELDHQLTGLIDNK